MWLMVLEAGKEWGLPPWAVEEQATALWWERWRVWREEKGRFEEGRRARGEGGLRQAQAAVMGVMGGMDG